MKKVLCVCFGNSCRSPIMQALLESKLKEKGIEAIVDSAGLAEKDPTPASDNAKTAIQEYGLSLENHISKHITKASELTDYDHIIVVDQKIKDELLVYGAIEKSIIILNEEAGGLPNPFGKDLDTYRECTKTIDRELNKIISALV